MGLISKPRQIVDRRILRARLETWLAGAASSVAGRPGILTALPAVLDRGTGEVRRRFEKGGRFAGVKAIRNQAFLVDEVIRTVFDFVVDHMMPDQKKPGTGKSDPGKSKTGKKSRRSSKGNEVLDQFAVLATGGYGRGELAPFSDVDLMFLLGKPLTPEITALVEKVLYLLWDLGLKVGHATRDIDEVVKLANGDLTIRTSLLESRRLWGNAALVETFEEVFRKKVVAGSGLTFVEQKLAERDARHERLGDARYVLEPNVKEGKGGLRDLQTLLWIAKYLFDVETMADLADQGLLTREDLKQFEKAADFLWTVRCFLHYLAGRPEERLTFNFQEEIGRLMGYQDRAGVRGVERFMKHYYLTVKGVGDLTRVLCALLEDQQKKSTRLFRWPEFKLGRDKSPEGFTLEGGRLATEDETLFEREPVNILRLFQTAQAMDLYIHPTALRQVKANLRKIDAKVRKDAEANALFLDLLMGPKPQRYLSRLNDAGVLGRFVPDFGRVVAQMQYDMYHVYTVDEHTIGAIGILDGIRTGRLVEDHPVAFGVMEEVQSLRVLYVAVLLHDIAKGRGGDHCVLGEAVALKLCPRFGLNEWETETVAWLVRNHLLMSWTAFKRDLDDPKTAEDFAERVQSPERLRLLLVLTVADIRGVGPNIWNAWKASLLRELYWQALAQLTGDAPEGRREQRALAVQDDLRARLQDWSEDEIETHLALGRTRYWLAENLDTLERHARLIKQVRGDEKDLLIETRIEPARDATEITIFAPGHHGMFAAAAGAMAVCGASIVDAKVHTMADGMALDTFWVQDKNGGPINEQRKLDRLRQQIEDGLRGKRNTRRDLATASAKASRRRKRVSRFPTRVIIDNTASNQHTVIEINGRDRIGLLHDITRALAEASVQIASAHISTYGERVVDVFYVKDLFGHKIRHKGKLEALEETVMAAIAPAAAPAQGKRRRARA